MNGQQPFWKANRSGNGFALPSTLMVLAIVSVLSLALATVSHATLELIASEKASDEAKNLAKAGLETALADVLRGNFVNNPHEDLTGGFFSYSVSPQGVQSVMIQVRAYSDDGATATVQAVADTKTGQLSNVLENP